jgi:hypothetical protein
MYGDFMIYSLWKTGGITSTVAQASRSTLAKNQGGARVLFGQFAGRKEDDWEMESGLKHGDAQSGNKAATRRGWQREDSLQLTA